MSRNATSSYERSASGTPPWKSKHPGTRPQWTPTTVRRLSPLGTSTDDRARTASPRRSRSAWHHIVTHRSDLAEGGPGAPSLNESSGFIHEGDEDTAIYYTRPGVVTPPPSRQHLRKRGNTPCTYLFWSGAKYQLWVAKPGKAYDCKGNLSISSDRWFESGPGDIFSILGNSPSCLRSFRTLANVASLRAWWSCSIGMHGGRARWLISRMIIQRPGLIIGLGLDPAGCAIAGGMHTNRGAR